SVIFGVDMLSRLGQPCSIPTIQAVLDRLASCRYSEHVLPVAAFEQSDAASCARFNFRDLSISRVRFDHRANAVEFGLQRFGEDCCTRLSRLARVPQDEDPTFALMRKDSASPHGWLQRNCRDRAERTSAQAPLLRRRSAMPYVPGYRVTSLQRVPLQDRRR